MSAPRRPLPRWRRLAGLLVLGLALTGLAACGGTDGSNDAKVGQQPQGAALRITLGTQEFPEARILGELWRQALAVNGYAVDLRKGVGPAADLDKRLRDGDIDGHVAYTGTVLSVVAGEEVGGLDPEQTYRRAKAFYDGRGLAMSAMTPFENKDAIATTADLAQREGLRTIADLRRVDGLRLGARPEFEDLQLGLRGVEQTYGLSGIDVRGRSRSASSTPPSTTATWTRSTRSPPTRSCAPGGTSCSRTRSCCSARRTS